MTYLVLIPTPAIAPTTIDALGSAPSMPDTADGFASAATHRQWSETLLTIYRCDRDGSWWRVIEEVTP